MNFNASLEKAKLKDDGSNYTDRVRNLRIIVITAYVSADRRHKIVGEHSNFKKIPTYTQDHGDGIATRGESVVHVPS